MENRLQFIKHEGVFETREKAYEYILSNQYWGAYPDATKQMPALYGEPMVLLYESDDYSKGPNVILAIGSVGDGVNGSLSNRIFLIDTQKTEDEINEINIKIEELEKLIGIGIDVADSDTLDLELTETETGNIISGNVKIADYQIVSGRANPNIITTVPNKGIFAFVDMDYDPVTSTLKFNVNGVSKPIQIPKDQHVERGWYDATDEKIYLKLADGSLIDILVTRLIHEWVVVGSASTTPITLFRDCVSATTEGHEGLYNWQDLLHADVRVADHIGDNILHKDRTGRYLYVKGTADNIMYQNGITVRDAIDNIDTKVSTSAGNLIYKRPDGIYATAMLDYNPLTNELIYKYSNQRDAEGNMAEVKFRLNSFEILDDISYDPVKEVIILRYKNATGEYQTLEIPVSGIIEEWTINNQGHNIELNKHRSQGQGADVLSADAKIYNGNNNILEDLNHELYVNGVAKNIKYDVTGDTTVKEVLDNLSGVTEDLEIKINNEIGEREAADNNFTLIIGSGFTNDPHENITYKFESLSATVNSESERLTNEIERSSEKDSEHDQLIEKIENEIGSGFSITNTVRYEIDALGDRINELSSSTEGKLSSVINEDHSIDVDNSDPVNPIISVNLSSEVEDNKPNIIKLNNDGLYAGVDLIYEFNEDTGSNQLIFKTTNGTKVYDLMTNSVVDKIYYDPVREAIIIEYTVNGKRMPDVVVPVGDLINEWRAWDGHEGAIQLEKERIASGTVEQDVLKASVVISDHDDNIIINDNGALYVSSYQITKNADDIADLMDRMGDAEENIDALEDAITNETRRAISAETSLQVSIDALSHAIEDEAAIRKHDDDDLRLLINNEIDRAVTAENNLNTLIAEETTRAITAESSLQTALNNEVTRATSEEARIEAKIDSETVRAMSAETALQTAITNETTRAMNAESNLQTTITNEVTRATNEETRLYGLITGETAARQDADDELAEAIRRATLTFEDTTSVDITKDANNVVTADVKVANADDNIIKVDGEKAGVYASVSLSYNPGTNKIHLVTSNGAQEEIQLNAGALLDAMEYDSVNRALVITYTDSNGVSHTLNFPVNELFNDWVVYNPSEQSAVELTKTIGTDGNPDTLGGRVLLTNLDDNLIRIVNNGLYVSGAGLTGQADCVQEEVKVIEAAIFGDPVSETCGSGFTYAPNENACFISAATSMNDADLILDEKLCQLAGLLNGSESLTTIMYPDQDGIKTDVRLSHSAPDCQPDEDLIITELNDPELSDNNVLRVVDLTSLGYSVGHCSNGLYLSNHWNCGEVNEGDEELEEYDYSNYLR